MRSCLLRHAEILTRPDVLPYALFVLAIVVYSGALFLLSLPVGWITPDMLKEYMGTLHFENKVAHFWYACVVSCALAVAACVLWWLGLYRKGQVLLASPVLPARHERWLVLAIGLALIVLAKAPFLPDEGGDYTGFVKGWFDYIRNQGVWRAYGTSFSNYTPFYTYLLGIAAVLTPHDASPLIPVKLVTLAGEVVAALAVYRLVGLRYSKQSLVPLLAPLSLPLVPTVLINGISAAQCDIWHTAFLLWAMYWFVCDRPALGMVGVALAVSFKIMGALIAPFMLALLLRGRTPWTYLIILPLVYLALTVPCLLEGRPIADMLFIYSNQFYTYGSLANNSANPYWFVPNELYAQVLTPGIVLSALVALAYAVRTAPKLSEGNVEIMLLCAALGMALLFFTMPKMHDRYLFAAEIFVWVLMFMRPHLWLVALLFQVASLSSYIGFLMLYQNIFPLSYEARMPYAVLMNAVGIALLAYEWWQLPDTPPNAAEMQEYA